MNHKIFLYDEVVIHNKWDDFWVVIHKNVFGLSPMIKDRRDSWNINMEYLMAFGGKDLSHLFHDNFQPKTQISPITGKPRVLFPPILETAVSEMCHTKGSIWSQDCLYHIGRLTRKERKVRIINTLTGKTQVMKVCEEDTIADIQNKYKRRYNFHAGSYEWRKNTLNKETSQRLNPDYTLTQNGLHAEKSGLDLPPPAIWLYYTDNFTIA